REEPFSYLVPRYVSDVCTPAKWNPSPTLCHARLQQKMRIISQLRCSRLCALYALITFGTAGFAQTAVPVNQPASPVASTVANGPDSKPILPGVDSAVRLGAGDLVEVSVYNVPELTTKLRVSTTGEIYLPLIDYVHVAG